jgi:hypothetical protein
VGETVFRMMRLARHREVANWEGKHDVHVNDISGAMLV